MNFTPFILVHIVTASSALLFGGIVLTRPKGTSQHRLLGRIWVVLMATAALTSFGIRTSGHFSWIHLLSIITLTAITSSLFAAIRGNIPAHRRGMVYSYIGLAIAGAFALRPGRQLGDLIWNAFGMF